MKSRLYTLIVLVMTSLTLPGQSALDEYKAMQYSKEDNTLNYRILYPDNFDTDKQYPVLLFLHGAGERGNDNQKQLVHGSELFLNESFKRNYPCVVLFPQCPTDSFWSNAEVRRDSGRVYLDFPNGGEPTTPLQLVMSLMDSIKSLSYSKDDQIYVGGLSMGGMGTFEILYRKPDMFAAAFPICGGGNPETVSRYADQTSVWVFHGAKDDVVLPSRSTEMVIALMKAGADVRYTLYKDANHNSWDPAFAEPGLLRWIFSKQREVTDKQPDR